MSTTTTLANRVRRLEARRVVAPRPDVAFDPVSVMRVIAGEPEAWQLSVLSDTAQSIALCCSRQIGKTAIASSLALSTALTKPGVTIPVVASREKQAAEIVMRCVYGYYQLNTPLGTPLHESTTTLMLPNRSRVLALPAKETAVRSYPADLLVCDEAAALPDSVYYAARPIY
jgi:tRNA(Met) C34 N-acetyltransferase TmcA